MRSKAFGLILILLLFLIPTNAAIRTDGFDGGINTSLWDVERYDASGSPWTIIAPDGSNMNHGRTMVVSRRDRSAPWYQKGHRL